MFARENPPVASTSRLRALLEEQRPPKSGTARRWWFAPSYWDKRSTTCAGRLQGTSFAQECRNGWLWP